MDPVKPDEVLAKANDAVLHLRDYVSAQVADRRANPRDDLLSSLLEAESDGIRLSEDELISNVLLLFGAGHETTMNQIGNALLALLQHPDQMALLRDRPELIPTAVEELLRYDAAVQFVHRWARESIEVGDVRTSRAVLRYCSLSQRPIATLRGFPTPTRWTLPEPRTGTWPSEGEHTFASDPAWRASK